MQTIIIGLMVDESFDNHEFFPPSLNVKIHGHDYRVVVHRNVDVTVTDKGPILNADIVIDFRHQNKDYFYSKLLGERYIHQGRLGKSEQLSLLSMSGVPGVTPFSVRSTPGTNLRKQTARSGFTTDFNKKKYVIKPNMGAKGEGQALVPSFQLTSFIDATTRTNNIKKLKELFPDVVFTKTESGELSNFNIITEFIDDIDKEYRVLVGGTSFWMYERTRQGDDYLHANIDFETIVNDESRIELKRVEHGCDLYEYVQCIVDAADIKLGSIDVFRRQNGELGVFEYSTQFGFYQIEPAQVGDIYSSFLTSIARYYVGPDLTLKKSEIGLTDPKTNPHAMDRETFNRNTE